MRKTMADIGMAKGAGERGHARAALDADSVRDAYRRWAGVYDAVFGGVSGFGRRRAVAAVNCLAGPRVLEVGVGTGLALPLYRRDLQVVGIDLSRDMLEKAQERVQAQKLGNVGGLLEMDAERMAFADASFDIAVAMFTASGPMPTPFAEFALSPPRASLFLTISPPRPRGYRTPCRAPLGLPDSPSI